jgi:hypothetical protein
VRLVKSAFLEGVRQLCGSEYICDPLQVDHHCEADFSPSTRRLAAQQTRIAEDAVLDTCERTLHD